MKIISIFLLILLLISLAVVSFIFYKISNSDVTAKFVERIYEHDINGDKYQDFVNRVTGCEKSESITKASFEKFARNCSFTELENRIFVKFPFDKRFKMLSIYADIPKENFSKINILLVGGPLSNTQTAINFKQNSLHKAFVDRDTAVFVPQYIGTENVSVYPNSDSEVAAQQIVDFIKQRSLKNVSIIGHSAGGYIAFMVRQKINISTTIFATPLISIRQSNYLRGANFQGTQSIFQMDLDGNLVNGDNISEIPSFDFYKKYHGIYFDDNLINDVINYPDIKLIYGENDFAYNIPKAQLPNFSAIENRICLIEDMGHQPENERDIQKLRDCFFKQ
jgi:alpha/beta superfamily hydrolase